MGGVHPSFFSLGQAGRLFASVSLGVIILDRPLNSSEQGLFVGHVVGHRACFAVLIAVKPIVGSARAKLDCYIANDA
jgi:hypothetical protein